jgi:hypothetical protein
MKDQESAQFLQRDSENNIGRMSYNNNGTTNTDDQNEFRHGYGI